MEDTVDQANLQSPDDVGNLIVQLMEGPELNDQLNGLNWLETQSYVDQNRVAVMGCSYGGIQTLLGAASDNANYKVAVAISPAAKSWGNLPVRQMVLDTVNGIDIPTFCASSRTASGNDSFSWSSRNLKTLPPVLQPKQ